MSVKSHLTYGASVRPENAVTYSVGNEGQKICGVFSETAPLQRSSTPCCTAMRTVGHYAYFSCTRMRISRVYTRMIHRRGFSTLVLFIIVGTPVVAVTPVSTFLHVQKYTCTHVYVHVVPHAYTCTCICYK